MTKYFVVGAVGLIAIGGLLAAVGKGLFTSNGGTPLEERPSLKKPAAVSETSASSGSGGAGLAAIEQAAQAKKYLFAFVWKTDDDHNRAMKKVFEEAVQKAGDRVQSVSVSISDPAENGMVSKFQLDRAPMPLALAIAPNGAVMGGFPQKFTAEDLLDAFGGPCTEQCMKLLQNNKLVFVCVQNDKTAANEEALRGVREFKADRRYAAATEIVMLDPSDAADSSFLADLKIDPKTTEAVTAFLAPPGAVIAEFKGATDKAELVAALAKASAGCGPGGACGPGGCGPQK